MFDEPENGKMKLVAVNDLPDDKTISYTVKKFEVSTDTDIEIVRGEKLLSADMTMLLTEVEISENEKQFYYIEWSMDGKTYKNHYFTNIISIDYQSYMQALKKYGMDEFEGF